MVLPLASWRRPAANVGRTWTRTKPPRPTSWATLTRFEQMERRVVAQRQRDAAEANKTAEWHALLVRDLAAQWVQREALAAVRW